MDVGDAHQQVSEDEDQIYVIDLPKLVPVDVWGGKVLDMEASVLDTEHGQLCGGDPEWYWSA